MDSLFDFEHSGETAASKLFSFHSETRLFHFLNDAAGSDITIGGAHMTDAAAAAPSGTTEKPVAVPTETPKISLENMPSGPSGEPTGSEFTNSGTGTTPTAVGVAESDQFLKSLTEDKKKNSDQDLVLQSLIKSEEKGVQKRQSILGELPKIDTSLFIDQEFHLKKQLSFVRITFASIIILGFAMYVFFFMQLSPDGNLFTAQNVGKKLQTTSDALKSEQTEINLNRYKTATEDLDQFFYLSNEYLQKYDAWQAADEKEKGTLAADLDTAKYDLIKPFKAARDILAKPNYSVVYRDTPLVTDTTGKTPAIIAEEEKSAVSAEFNDALKADIADKKRALLGDLKTITSATDKNAKRTELRALNETALLVGNTPLQQLISTDVEKMSHEQLRKHIIAISAKYNNRLAFIFQIKDKRIPWASIIKEIYNKTEASDSRFATKLYATLGGIQYTGFDFDGTTGRLTISGSVKDANGENFKILAILLDQLEGSTKLKDVEMRNFSKTFSEKEGYEGNFKIDFSLQVSGEIDERDKVIDLTNGAKLFNITPTK